MIDKNEILRLTQGGLNIFSHFLGFEVNLHRNFRSPFYEDKRASCHIYLDRKTAVYRFYDHGDPTYSGDCFWFVATLLGLDLKRDFPQVIEAIVQHLSLQHSLCTQGQTTIRRPSPNKSSRSREGTPIVKEEKDSPYSFELQSFDDNLLNYWAHYGIFEDTLSHFQVRSLKRYESVSSEGKSFVLHSSPTEPIFSYIGTNHIKIYRPHSAKLRFLYGGRIPNPYCFGMEQLPTKGDMLFITG